MRIRFRFPALADMFLISNANIGSGAHPASYAVGIADSLPYMWRAGAWSWTFTPSSVVVKNAWNYRISALSLTTSWRGAWLSRRITSLNTGLSHFGPLLDPFPVSVIGVDGRPDRPPRHRTRRTKHEMFQMSETFSPSALVMETSLEQITTVGGPHVESLTPTVVSFFVYSVG